MSEQKRAGVSFTRRGDRIEATYNVPSSELPEGAKRKRITAHGETETEAQKKLLAKLATTDYKTPAPVKTDEFTLSEWLDEWVEDYLRYRVQESTRNVSARTYLPKVHLWQLEVQLAYS